MKYVLFTLLLTSMNAIAMQKNNDTPVHSFHGAGLARAASGVIQRQILNVAGFLNQPNQGNGISSYLGMLPNELRGMLSNYYYHDSIVKIKNFLSKKENSKKIEFKNGHLRFRSFNEISRNEILEIISLFREVQFQNSPYNILSLSFPPRIRAERGFFNFNPFNNTALSLIEEALISLPYLENLDLTFMQGTLLENINFTDLAKVFEKLKRSLNVHFIFTDNSLAQLQNFIKSAKRGQFKFLTGLTLSSIPQAQDNNESMLIKIAQENERAISLISSEFFPNLTELNITYLQENMWKVFLESARSHKFVKLKKLTLNPFFQTTKSVTPPTFFSDLCNLFKNKNLINLTSFSIRIGSSVSSQDPYSLLLLPEVINHLEELTHLRLEYLDSALTPSNAEISSYITNSAYLLLNDIRFTPNLGEYNILELKKKNNQDAASTGTQKR